MIRKARAVWRGNPQNCPISRVLKAEITLDARLV